MIASVLGGRLLVRHPHSYGSGCYDVSGLGVGSRVFIEWIVFLVLSARYRFACFLIMQILAQL